MLFHTTDGCGYCCFPAAFSVCAPPVPLDTLLFAKNPFYILPHRLNVSFRFILVSISPLVVSIFITTTSFTRVGGSFPQFRCNQSSWLIPAVKFTHPSLPSRNHFVERERERQRDCLLDWSIVFDVLEQSAEKLGVLCILGFVAEFWSYRDLTKSGVDLGFWGSV